MHYQGPFIALLGIINLCRAAGQRELHTDNHKLKGQFIQITKTGTFAPVGPGYVDRFGFQILKIFSYILSLKSSTYSFEELKSENIWLGK